MPIRLISMAASFGLDPVSYTHLVECWEVNLAEPGSSTNSGKYKSKYYQGYITELGISSNAEDNVEVSITYGANGQGADGYATLTDEQKEIASYVYKDVIKELSLIHIFVQQALIWIEKSIMNGLMDLQMENTV